MTLSLALYLALIFAAGLLVCEAVLVASRWLYARIRRDLDAFQRSAEALGAKDRAADEHARWLGADQA